MSTRVQHLWPCRLYAPIAYLWTCLCIQTPSVVSRELHSLSTIVSASVSEYIRVRVWSGYLQVKRFLGVWVNLVGFDLYAVYTQQDCGSPETARNRWTRQPCLLESMSEYVGEVRLYFETHFKHIQATTSKFKGLQVDGDEWSSFESQKGQWFLEWYTYSAI